MKLPIKPYHALVDLCQLPEIKENAREVNEMLGFICAIAASPETLDLPDWLPDLWAQGLPSFSNAALASDFAAATLQFYEYCLVNYHQSMPLSLPLVSWLDEYLQITDEGIAFASGYLAGFRRTEQFWKEINLISGSESEQLLHTTTLLLSKMATINSTDLQMQALFIQLPNMDEIINSLPLLLSAFGHAAAQINVND